MNTHLGRRLVLAISLALVILLPQGLSVEAGSLKFRYWEGNRILSGTEKAPGVTVDRYGNVVRFSGSGTIPGPDFCLKAELVEPNTTGTIYPPHLIVDISIECKDSKCKQRYLVEAGFEGEITGLSTGLYYVTIVYDKVAIAQENVIISGG